MGGDGTRTSLWLDRFGLALKYAVMINGSYSTYNDEE